MTRLILGALVAALSAPASPVVSPAPVFGPPWISIEHPVNPYDETTRGAYLVVHAFHHGTPTGFPVTGTAEGLVNGQRRTVKLDFKATSRTGAFALTKQWPSEGTWSLVITVAQGPEDGVSAIVDIGATGDVARVQVPTRRQDSHTIPAKVSMGEVEASLRARARA
ncbi:MAG: hypothetical protein H7066_09145 [Cytophagaceae bacterium]|nr:hypothetical protein [Gemmatimonadaceae bacterium]